MANAMVSRCVALPATETARRRLAMLPWTMWTEALLELELAKVCGSADAASS